MHSTTFTGSDIITLLPVYWATIVLLTPLSDGKTNTHTNIVKTNRVLQLLLEPTETGDLIQLNALSYSMNGD